MSVPKAPSLRRLFITEKCQIFITVCLSTTSHNGLAYSYKYKFEILTGIFQIRTELWKAAICAVHAMLAYNQDGVVNTLEVHLMREHYQFSRKDDEISS